MSAEGRVISNHDNLTDLLSGPPPAPDWIVPNLIPRASMVALSGMAGVGKSVLGYTLSLALGSGLPILNRPTTPARVLYMDEENGHRDRKAYVYRAWVGLNRPDIRTLEQNVRIHGFTLACSDHPWDIELKALILGFQPDLMIIDTATPALRIVDENSNSEAAIACRKLRGLMNLNSNSMSILVFKHLRADAKTGHVDMRGAKFWKGHVDASLYHRRPGGRPRKDGLYRTYIRPDKTRAFGLTTEIMIDARRTEDGAGLVLEAQDIEIREKELGFGE